MEKDVLKIENISFAYEQKNNVLDNINLSVQKGERLGIIGPNGAGKTTLFMIINGILKPVRGSIEIYGKEIKKPGFIEDLGFVFQNPDDQLFCPSVWEDVKFGPANLGFPAELVEERAEKALLETDLLELKDRAPHHLSGGEKRMAAIAGILAMDPKLIIYDEPVSNLDSKHRRKLINFLLRNNKTYIVSSHDLEFIIEVCTRIVVLDEGQIVANGDPSDILKDSAFMEKHGLEVPYSLKI